MTSAGKFLLQLVETAIKKAPHIVPLLVEVVQAVASSTSKADARRKLMAVAAPKAARTKADALLKAKKKILK